MGLLSFKMDVNTGRMTLSFDETVDGFSLEPVEFQVLDGVAKKAASLQLTGGIGTNGVAWVKDDSRSRFDHADSDVLVMSLLKADLDELKRLALCTEQDDCYLIHTEWAIRDKAGNQIVACT